jgi:hypothetical protein
MEGRFRRWGFGGVRAGHEGAIDGAVAARPPSMCADLTGGGPEDELRVDGIGLLDIPIEGRGDGG